MNRIFLNGMSGNNPLHFLASVGLLRLLYKSDSSSRLAFGSDPPFKPLIDTMIEDVISLVATDAANEQDERDWLLTYDKTEKKGVKTVADLKAPPQIFRRFAHESIEAWLKGRDEAASYAAAYGTTTAEDGKKNTKPTAFHFTAANQQFLDTVRSIRQSLDREWINESLFQGHATRSGTNLRWDPAAERNWALMPANPNDEGTVVDGPLEWLAFRGLPLLPSFPRRGKRIVTTGVRGRGDEMAWTWPLWSVPSTVATIRSMLGVDWSDRRERSMRGVFCLCTSPIRRTGQGFGNFGPPTLTP